MRRSSYWLIVMGYGLTVLGLFFYSFTQVDLNLTLSQALIIQNFQKFFIQIGYFNRPLSTVIFLILIFLFSIFYFLFLWLVKKNKLSEKQIWFLIILLVVVLLFSYPAFSHDIFNYMFWARIFTHYGFSPYEYKPLDFPTDPWIRFMHWTHVTYNHGPVFLPFSFVPSFLGFGKFILTLLNFKLLAAVSFLGSVFFINKIMGRINPKNKLLAVSFFALNPLIITEALISGHNDILMLFFALISLYLLTRKKNLWSLFFLFISAGIKFITISLLPLYILVFFSRKINWQQILKFMIIFLLICLIPLVLKREPYPWYFIVVFGIASLIVENSFISLTFLGLTLGLLLRYAPFLYFGNYQPPVPILTFWLTVIPVILSITVWFIFQIYHISRKSSD